MTNRLSASRREFLKSGAALAAAVGLSGSWGEVFAQGIQRLAQAAPCVLWLQGQACSGCSISWLNAEQPPILEILRRHIRMAFHPLLSAAQGKLAVELIEQVHQGNEPFFLVVEGAIPSQMPEACRIAGRSFAEVLAPALRRAQFIVAAGACASFGGVPAAEGNATGAAGVRGFMEKAGIPFAGRLVTCPGCPCHPQELSAALAHLAAKGYPKVRPTTLTPTMFTENCVHNDCPRFSQHNQGLFASQFSDQEGCLLQLGCRGPDVFADCARHQWNGVNWCVQAGAPCIGCVLPEFARDRSGTFYHVGDATQ